MSGILYRAVPKQIFIAKTNGYSLYPAKGIDLTNFREASLIVRVHSGTAVGTGTFSVNVYQDAPTAEDGTDFIGVALATAVEILSTSNPGDVTVRPLGSASSPIPAAVRVKFTCESSATGQVVISADIVGKS